MSALCCTNCGLWEGEPRTTPWCGGVGYPHSCNLIERERCACGRAGMAVVTPSQTPWVCSECQEKHDAR